MKAVVCKELNKITVEEVTLDPPKAGEVRIKVAAAGVCHSDLSMTNGTMPAPLPMVLGHEAAGVVASVGDGVTHVTPGDHVVLSFVPTCGDCFHCLRDEAFLCQAIPATGTYADGTKRVRQGDTEFSSMTALGAMAEEAICPAISVVPIDKDIPLPLAALVGCGVTTGVGAVIKTAKVPPGASVAIFGCGGVGLAAIQGARLAGAGQVIAIDAAASKEEFARQCGATDFVDASQTDPVAALRERTGGVGVDYAFEAIGIASVMEQAHKATRRGGTAVIIGMGKFKDTVKLDAWMLPLMAKKLVGSFYGNVNPRVDVPRLLELNRSGKLDLASLVTKTYTIDEAPQAFDDMQKGVNARGVIVFD